MAAGFAAELRRRGVVRAVIAYAVFAFAVLQVIEPVLHGLRLPDWTLSAIVVALATGFPVVIIVSWAFDLTSKGFRRAAPAATSSEGLPLRGSRWPLLVMTIVGVLAGVLLTSLAPRLSHEAPRITLAAADFVNETHDEDLDALSGLLITSLEQSRRLSVLTRSRMFDVLKQLGRGNVVRIDEALGREICAHAHVDALVLASIHKFGQLYAIDLKIVDPARNEHLFAAKEEGRGKESIPAMIDRLSERTRAGLREKAEEIGAAKKPVSYSATANLEAYRHFFQAEELVARGDLTSETFLVTETASRELRRAIELDPDFALAHFRLGFVLGWAGKRGALQEEEIAIRQADRLPARELCHARALRTGHRGDWPQAIRLIHQCASQFPDDKLILMQAGDWPYHRGDLAVAVPYFERTLAIDPAFVPAFEHLLMALQGLERRNEALERARAFAALNHDDTAHELLALAHGIAGDMTAALDTLRAGTSSFPRSARLLFATVRAHMFVGRPAEAEEPARKLKEIDRETGHWATIRLDAYRGRFRRVIAACEHDASEALKTGNRDFAAKLIASKAYELAFGLADLEGAKKAAAEAKSLVPDESWLFQVYAGLGMEDEARDLLGSPALAIWADLELEALRASHAGQSVDATTRLVSIPYFEHKHLYALASHYFDANEIDKAVATLRRLQRTYPGVGGMPAFLHWYPRSFYLLGRAQELAGNAVDALATYDRFLDLWKDADPEIKELQDAKARAAGLRLASR